MLFYRVTTCWVAVMKLYSWDTGFIYCPWEDRQLRKGSQDHAWWVFDLFFLTVAIVTKEDEVSYKSPVLLCKAFLKFSNCNTLHPRLLEEIFHFGIEILWVLLLHPSMRKENCSYYPKNLVYWEVPIKEEGRHHHVEKEKGDRIKRKKKKCSSLQRPI